MLDIITQHHGPVVFAMLKDRKLRGRETQISKEAKRHRGQARPSLYDIGNRRAADGTKLVGCLVATVGNSSPSLGFTAQGYLVVRPSRLSCESAAAPLLAVEAMAHRDSDRFALADCLELPASARSGARRHLSRLAFAFTPLSYKPAGK
jgi:hypothetical protein